MIPVNFFMPARGSRRLRSKGWRPPRIAGEAQTGTAAEVSCGVQERGAARGGRRRRQHRRQRARARRALAVRRGGRALHVRAGARRHGSAARQHVLRLRGPAVVR